VPGRIVDDRGAIMAEAVIVVPFLLIIWFGLDALVQLYAVRLHLQVAAGAQAMAMAESGDCGEADVSLADMPQTAGTDASLTSEQGSMIEDIAGCQPFAWAHANVTAADEVDGLNERVVAGGAREVAGQRSLMCNMKPVDGLMDLIAGFVSEALGLGEEE
jgi:hypothetical protein